MATKKSAAATKKSGTTTKRPGISRLGALRRVDEKKWEREIRKAMKAAGGRVDEAAEALGVARRTLFLALQDPRFADVPRAPASVHRSGDDE